MKTALQRHRRFALVVSDVDGTLVDSQKEVPPYTSEEISRVRRHWGVDTLLASSRMPSSLLNLRRELGATTPIVAYDGALVLEASDGHEESTVVQSKDLDFDIVQEVLATLPPSGVHVGIFSLADWVVGEIDFWTLREVRGTRVWPTVAPLSPMVESWRESRRQIHKLMIRGEEQALDEVVAMIQGIGGNVRVARSRGTMLELLHPSADKAQALEIVLDRLGIDRNSVLAFGDSINDITMLKFVGHGVAVANAPDSVKKVAKEITLTNDEDGVGFLLGKYFP